MKPYRPMRALVTGAGGQLGQDLCRLLPGAVGLDRRQLPITDPDAVRSVLAREKPGIVFNCAAFNGVDAAESDISGAWEVSAEAPGRLAVACRQSGVRLVHFSTNYVFSGEGDRPWTEEDEPRPASGYARSKLEGEHRVHGELPEALLVRCAGLYGRGGSAIKGGSFPERILARARAGEKLRVIHDQRLNPTWTADLAEGVLALVERGTTGLVHLVADGCCSWYEFAEAILRLAAIDAPLSAIGTPPTGPRVACRPRNGCLSSLRVPPLRPWREGLSGYLASWEAG